MSHVVIDRDINNNPVLLEYDERLSFRDFTNWDFKDRPEYDLSGKVIYASCFFNETPDSDIFKEGMTGATFVRCNLNNVVVPIGNGMVDCTNETIVPEVES